MAVTITQSLQLSTNSWLLSWSSDLPNPTFYVYRDGVLIDTTSSNSKIFTVANDEQLLVEVLDNATDTPLRGFPGRSFIQWLGQSNAHKYVIEELVGGTTWTVVESVLDRGQSRFDFTSRFLEDGQSHSFRVTPVSEAQNSGTPIVFTIFMVRYPDRPSVSLAYDSGPGTVTISAA